MLNKFLHSLRRLAARRPAARRAVVEELEPRILYSADANPLVWGALDSNETAVVGAVDAGQGTCTPQVVDAPHQQERRRELVFVDAAVADAQRLIDGIVAARGPAAQIEIVHIRSDADGLQQIADVLSGERDVEAVHILSHGSAGTLQLGNTRVDAATLGGRAEAFADWRIALKADADLLLYGCNVAEGAVGEAFIQQLAATSGADVAASADLTGAASQGGDWQLEYQTGRIEASVVVGAQAQRDWAGLLAVSVDNSSTGSASVASSVTVSHTTTSTGERLMLVGVTMDAAGGPAVSSVTYGGQSLTLVGTRSGGANPVRVEIWRLINPPSGTANVVVNLSGNADGVSVGVTTFTGVNQSTPLGTFASAIGSSAAPSVAVTSASGELVYDVVAAKDGTSLTQGAGQTELWELANGIGDQRGASSTEAGAATVTMSWSKTTSGTAEWAIGAVSIKPSTIQVTPTSGLLTTEAGGTASFNVVLMSAPTADVTIAVSSSDTTEGTVSTSSLVFTSANWNVAQTVTVTGVNDTLDDGNIAFNIVTGAAVSSDAAYSGLAVSDVALSNTDDDTFNTVVVTNTSDTVNGTTTSIAALMANNGGDGISLREAIIAANNTANGVGGADRIHFNIALTDANHLYYRNNAVAGTFSAPVTTTLADAAIVDFDADYAAGTARSWYRISLSGNYLDVTQAVVIDGSTQAGFITGSPVIEINAAGITTAGDENAIALTSGASTIRGLVINSAGDNAIEVDVNADNSVIVGNYLGTDVSGTQARGNATLAVFGALAVKADGVVIGGTTAADRNVISGNVYYGIEIYSSASGSSIRGNYIGTRADGSATLGNGLSGIYLQGGAFNHTIGGTAANEGNLIAGNGGDGVWVGATAGAGNAILGNTIYSNTGLAIDLGANGVTANDANDGDSGANDLLNFPVVTKVVQNGANLDVTLVLDVPAGNYRIELYQNPAGIDPTRHGEGQVFLGALSVTSTGSGAQTLTGTLNNVTASSITRISATATRDLGSGVFGSTSEFGPRAGLVVSTTADTMDGTTTSVAALISNPGADGQISLREAITAANASAGTDYIYFDITAALTGGVHTITLAYDGADAGTTPDALPIITSPVVINGWTEPDYAGAPVIELNGNNVGTLVKGLELGAGSGGSTIRGLIINRFTGTGLEISGSNNHTIQGNWIGLNASGTAAAGNGNKGIYALNSTGLLIGTNADGTNDAAERNVVSGNAQQGIYFENVDNSTISGNYVGTNAAGTGDVNGAVANTAQSGVFLTNGSSGNVVGGTSAGARNVLSGNNHFGFEVLNATSQNNLLQGNYIGTDATGLVALGNINGGAVFWGAGTGNVFGGGAAGARNVIAGNTFSGVVVGNVSTGATVQGNYIGVGADGATVLANGGAGVSIEGGSTGTLVGTNLDGSNDSAERNVIAGNGTSGVVIDGAATTGTLLRGNWIGLDAPGNARGNAQAGVFLTASASNNTVGGTAAGAGNTIAFSGWDGIRLSGTGTGNAFLGNSLYGNAEQAIDIGAQGVTPNDADDPDSGGNNLQNFPRLTLARTNGSNQLTLNGSLDSTANTWFRIEFFANPAQDGSGYGEGQTYLGSVLVQTDGSGDATISTTLAANVAAGSFISATATQTNAAETAHSNTSEFARNVYALPLVQGALVVDTTNDVVDGDATSISTLLANKGADGFISLREAVIASNNTSGNDTLNLAAGTYTLTIAGAGDDSSATGDIDIQTNITIAGAGMASTIISGGGIDRAIEVDGSGNLTLADVRLTGGSVNNDGGGLLVEEAGGTATLTRVDITGNTITGGGRIGGGIHNVGTLILTDSLVHGNTATGSDGGGISNLGTATITRSSIFSNSARYGGGVHQLAGATTVENATVSGNSASSEGGGIDVAAGTLTMSYSTVAANTAAGGSGGGVMVRAGTLTALSSIFADNSSSSGGRDLHGTFTSLGYNIVEHNAGFTGAVGTDQLGTDPSLAALALDAASGQYVHALNAGSIAINTAGGTPPATDQRGVTRDAGADVGSYERVNVAPVLDNAGTMTLTTIDEDQTNNVGDLVSSIISSAGGDRITDANADPEGIAITSLVSGNGTWEYSITGGASWITIGTVTNASALLLRSSDRVRFVPNAVTGTSASFTFRAWDRNAGVQGTKVDAASNGGSTAFSLATENATIAVTHVNDAPVAVDDRPALSFDGVDDYVSVPNSASLVMNSSMTLEAWINPDISSNVTQMIANKEGEYELAIFGDGSLNFAFAEGGVWNWHATGATIARNAWTHVAVTYDAGVVTTYVNGVSVDSHSLATTTIDDVYPALNELRIGGRSNGPAGQYFDGRIADVRVWNVARSPAQIAGAMNSALTGAESGLAGHWALTDNSGASATDTTANANHGTLVNGCTWAGWRIGEDGVLNAPAPGVLGNDYDADGDAMTAVLVSGTANGSLTLNANGSFIYTPNANWHGTDSFTYRVNDGTVNGNVASVTIVVDSLGDAPTGAPVVTGTPAEDQTLSVDTSTIGDGDGLGVFSYQWQRDGVNIAAANGSTYTLGDSDLGSMIRVIVAYTDGNGTAESLTSAAVGPIANVNDAPSGAPVVTGTATEDQTLSADTSSIADADGLGPFSYQWQRNGVAIGGATGSTYTLGDADAGTNIRVAVSYTDGNGTTESLTSAAVGPIVNVNDAPSGAPVVTGTTTEDQTLAADTSSIADADGLGAFSYQWQRNGVAIAGATASTYTLGDADVGTNIRVVVSYTDAKGTAESRTSAAVGPVANVNDAPSGAPVVTGTATEDQVLTANTAAIADADGLGVFSYQWQRNGVNIGGATGSTYTLGDADVGTNIRVVVSYTDARGTAESLTSAAVGLVANVNDAPSGAPAVTGTATEDQTLSANTSLITDADGLGAFGYQWQRNGTAIVGATGSTYTLGDADVGAAVRVIVSYVDGHGTAESLTSAAVGPIASVNDAPTGGPVVTGTATEDQTLSADTSSIADADGLGTFSYQWQRNGASIAGATASTYTLGDADVATSIRVIVSYTDGHGTAESLTSAAVGPIANLNDAPSGVPSVTGTAIEDQTLSADTSSITDADGLGAFSYQWHRNGVAVAGATGSSYTLGDADVGTSIRVVVSYTDGRGTAESVASAAVGPIANLNDAPSGAPVINGTPTEDQPLGADTSTIADADGLGAFSYQWQRNGVAVAGATGSTYTVGDMDVGASIRVIVSYTDGHGTAESLTSAAVGPIANVNDAPSGAPVVTGSATEDQTLGVDASSIADADGLGAFSYQWQRNGVAVAGATASTYTLGDADVGSSIRVVVSYIDGRGAAESLTSAAVGPVANLNDAPSGAPVVIGTPTEDQTLSADTSPVADVDGLGVFSYQWQRNGVAIAGAISSTYTLGDADVGASIRVVVSYTDGHGTAESLTSAAVGPVVNVNDAPGGAPVITGAATEDQTLSANTSSIADADGLGPFSYQWQRNGVTIGGATGSTYTLGDADVGAAIRVIVSYTDGRGTAESLTSASVGPIANVNDAPSGAPAVTGTATEDQTLGADTATITDADGLGVFAYQWQRNGANIAGATTSTYTLGDADVGAAIRLIVVYTDAQGAAESLTSAAVGPVVNVNDAPSGAPVVTGSAIEDQTLGADTSAIADADDLGVFAYQWQRNGVAIAGATGSTYLLGDADVGASMRVIVSYTDASGTPESLTSAAVGPVANVNDAPSGAPVVTGIATEDQTLSADTSSIADADGLNAFSYQWQRNGVAIAGATGSTYTLGDADVGASMRVIVSYTDGNGTPESLTSAAVGPVANVNDAPSGAPVVTGIATEDQTLSADTSSIADADGLNPFSYQWQRNGVAIAGATGSTYTPGDADVGASIRVIVSYTDGNGSAESLTSTAVGPVANANDAPTGAPVVNGTANEDQTLSADTSTIADADGLGVFAYQWQRNGVAIAGATGSTYTLGDADVGASIRVIVSYTDGNGTAESLTSAAVGPVANVNDAPSGAPVVTGSAIENQTLGADASSIADADGLGAFSYQWHRNGVAIAGATGSTYTLGDTDVGTSIRVVVSYTDGHGTAESLTSAAVGPVGNVNDAPSGAPVVTGTATEDQTLGADTSSIADTDGLGAFSYQWQRNGVAIAGATGSTYTLGDADVGASIRVVVSYTDGHGTAESLTSAAVGPVGNVNDAPSGAPVVTGTATEDQTLGADTSSIADTDGLGAFSYQWQRNGVAIAGATGSTYTLGDADVGASIRVVVSYTDGHGTAESLTSAAVGPVANVNDAPNGAPIVTGTPTEDRTLSADTSSIADADGLGAFAYQWQRNGVAIAGATASTYTLGDADVGASIRVVMSYTDGHGTAESLTSAAVGPVANVNDVPSGAPVVTGTPTEDQTLSADTSTIVDVDGLGAFNYQWQRNGVGIAGATGSTYTLGDTDVGASIRVIVSYTDGNGSAESLASAAVGPVANVNDAPSGAPAVTGSAIEDQTLSADTSSIIDADVLGAFSYQWQRNGANIAGATGSTHTLGDADVGTSIRVVVSYTDGNGTPESLTSAAVGPVVNVNDAPTGTPSIAGAPTEDQTLGADTSTIADADGLGTFEYQWQRNGVAITGATASTYTLGDADVGTSIRVVVSYTDGNGTAESLTSAAVGPVVNVNDAPSGAPSIAGTPAEDQTLSADTSTIADADGLGTFAYQWQRNGVAIAGATNATYTLGDADVGASISAVVSYTDGNGTAESLTSAGVGPIANVNDAPVITSNGGGASATITLGENQTLVTTVTSIDVDGAAPQYSVSGGADAARFAIDAQSGALSFVAAPNFEAPADADTDNVYQLVVSVSDGHGGTASQSIAVAIANINEAPGNIASTAATVLDHAAAGTLVATVTASDPDSGDLFTFSLVNDGAGRFVVDAANGRLTVAPGALLDFGSAQSHTLLLQVTDAGGLTTQQTIVVSLLYVDEANSGIGMPPLAALPPVPIDSSAPPLAPLPGTQSRESSAGRDETPYTAPPLERSVVSGESSSDEASAARPSWLLQRGAGVRDGAAVLVATVSFNFGTLFDGSQAAFDAALLNLGSDDGARPSSLLIARGSSVEAESLDGAQQSDQDPISRSVLAAVQDPVRVASATLTAGFVWWLTRSGGLLTSILMGIPAWRHVDLLPVLAPARDDDEDDDDSDSGMSADSLSESRHDTMVDQLFSNTSRLFGQSRLMP